MYTVDELGVRSTTSSSCGKSDVEIWFEKHGLAKKKRPFGV